MVDNKSTNFLSEDDSSNICEKCRITCCRDARPPITSDRRKIIETYFKTRGIDATGFFVNNSYTFPKETSDGYCIFLDMKENKCSIHPIKPETCIAGPVTFDISIGKKRIEWFLKTEQICPLAGVLFNNKTILKKHLEQAKKNINNLVNLLSGEELKARLGIEEPHTFKIDEDVLTSIIISKLVKASSIKVQKR